MFNQEADRVSTSVAKPQLAKIVSLAEFSKKVTVLQRHGRDAAAVVPMEFLHEVQNKRNGK